MEEAVATQTYLKDAHLNSQFGRTLKGLSKKVISVIHFKFKLVQHVSHSTVQLGTLIDNMSATLALSVNDAHIGTVHSQKKMTHLTQHTLF